MRVLPPIALCAFLCAGPVYAQQASLETTELETLTVSATRTGKPATALPYTITIIGPEELEQQLALGNDIAQVLANLIPSYAPSRQKLTSFGESLRGRDPLFLIDGVPQSNPLRDGSRDTYTIDLAMIQRIEVIHGANAIQGTGATGGIINIVTKTAAPKQPAQVRTSLQFTTHDKLDSDSFGYRGHVQYAAGFDRFDVLLGASYETTGVYFDAEDRPIGSSPTQGDTMDGDGYDLFAKLGYNFGDQRLQFMANRFDFQSDGERVNVPGNRDAGIPATSIPGTIRGIPAQNEVTTLSLDYDNASLGPGRLHWQLYRQDFEATYGGGTFGVFQDPSIAEEVFDQSLNRSEKLGSKLTYTLPEITDAFDMTLGLDYLQDTTAQELPLTGRTWVPETEYVNWAPFAQFNLGFNRLKLSAGARHESAELQVDDFTTIAFYNNTFVEGGSPDFEETLYNAGAVFDLTRQLSVFANYSEGFNMPDVGRVLRAVNTPGLRVESFLDLQPVIADNREIGLEYFGADVRGRVSYFTSDSDLGSRLVPDEDGIFSVQREKTEIRGIEASGEWCVTASTCLGLNYAALEGEFDSDDDGAVDSDLGGINIAPDRLNTFWEQSWSPAWSTRLQLSYLFDRDFEQQGVDSRSFEGYALLDLVLNWRINTRHQLQFAVENLLDEQYITYYSQVYEFAGTDDFFAGRGRQFYLTWRAAW